MNPADLVARARELQAAAAQCGQTITDAEAVAEASKESKLRAIKSELEQKIARERARREAARSEASRLRPAKASAGPPAKASQPERMETVRLVSPVRII